MNEVKSNLLEAQDLRACCPKHYYIGKAAEVGISPVRLFFDMSSSDSGRNLITEDIHLQYSLVKFFGTSKHYGVCLEQASRPVLNPPVQVRHQRLPGGVQVAGSVDLLVRSPCHPTGTATTANSSTRGNEIKPVGVNIYSKENDLPLPFVPTNICPLRCLDGVVNVDVDERGRAGPTTNLL
jgi:hypothetical protein